MLNVKHIAGNKKPRILLAEDELQNAKLLKVFLTDFEIVHCWNGLEAFDQFLKENFVAVITDNQMPIGPGLDLLKKIRAVDLEKPVYVYSGDSGMKEEYLQSGASYFFEKSEYKELRDFLKSTFLPQKLVNGLMTNGGTRHFD
jgi:CheY-like chemotaxis protein